MGSLLKSAGKSDAKTDAKTASKTKATVAASPTQSGLRLVLLISILLVVAFAFGGGGVRYGLANLVVQLTALAILAFHRGALTHFWQQSPLAIRVLTGLSFLVPALYLVPLPETIWSALPGRDLMAQSREAIGVTGWAPASADPARTLVAMTGMIVPAVILTVGWSIPRRHLMSVGWVLVAIGIICFVIGAPQVLSGGSAVQIYEERPPASILLGTFANRNSTGLFLVSALTMAALLPLPLARPHPAALPVRLGICALLLVGIVLTQSRTALALALIPIGLGCLRGFVFWRASAKERRGSDPDRSGAMALSVLALGAVAIGAVLTLAPGRLGDTLERFENLDDPRAYVWDDATYSAQRYWPVGAGMGTFDEVFQIDESLENLAQRRAGRAHNDYIELAIEAGAFGLALLASWMVLVVWFSWKARTSRFRWAAWASTAVLTAVALQSITDYPLRNQAMLAVAAFALLMLARIASAASQEPKR